MVASVFVHIGLIQLDNFFIWLAGRFGVPFWVALIGSILLIYILWRPLTKIIKLILKRLGV